MKDFISEYCDRYKERINPDLFDRSFDKPLVEYVIDTCRNLEVLPAITLESYEYIEDQSKIDTILDKKWIKDPKIKNNKSLDRLVGQNQSLYNLLILNFRVDAKGQTAQVQRKIRIPKLIKGRYYMRGGKLVLPLIQIVDNSTFVKGNTLNFKTTLYPIKLNTTRVKLPFIDDEISVPKFHIDLFKKITSPLYYYLAQYGLQGTIEMFRLENIVSVVDDILDDSKYMYIRINPNLYIEVHEKGFYAHEFVGKFLGCLYEVFSEDKKISLKDVYNREYWLGRLAEVFSKKRNPDKGERVLISFKKITDPYTKARLKLSKYHKRDTFRIVRWMMVNYTQLLQKDSNDLINKRMRVNEIQAYYFDSYIARNVYSLLNTDNPPFQKYVRLLNSINEYTLIRAATSTPKGKGGNKASITSMYRYERYNDFDAIDLTRYTLKGPTGLNGGKKKTSMQYRDIYPSHIGRYDLNVCSSSDPGLTGYLTANCQFDKNGHFSSENNEPDEYDAVIDELIDNVAEKNYAKKRAEYVETQLSRDADGFLHLQFRKSAADMTFEFMKNPWKYGLYWYDNGLHLMHKLERDNKGFVHLQQKSPSQKKLEKDYERDDNNFIVFRRKENKLTKKLNGDKGLNDQKSSKDKDSKKDKKDKKKNKKKKGGK